MSAEKDREPVSDVSSQATMPAGAVFLSYASEDAAAAEQIAAAHNVGLVGDALKWARRYDDSAQAYQDVLSNAPDDLGALWGLMTLDYYRGEFKKVRSLCEGKLKELEEAGCQWYLSLTSRKEGRDADAEASLRRLKVLRGASIGEYELATIYAQWGDTPKALERLEAALRDHEWDLRYVRVDPLLDPLRNKPRFKVIERELGFPE